MISTTEHGSVNMVSLIDDDHYKRDIPSSPEIKVQFYLADDKMSTIQGSIQESSQEFFPQADGIHDGTETDHDTSYIRNENLKQYNPISDQLPKRKK